MKYKLSLLVLCAGLQGSVQAEGGFFSNVKNKMFGWFGRKDNQLETRKELSLDEITQQYIDHIMENKMPGKAGPEIAKLCRNKGDLLACKKAAKIYQEVAAAMQNASDSADKPEISMEEILKRAEQQYESKKK
ncbi:MAG: hypothetical protein BGO07_00220 [Alphaproteobacteria bacterium 40-19]|nr:MAG: hypothetical protein BGO07_00220 [Alphaproteobacteria bacterium 40-19]